MNADVLTEQDAAKALQVSPVTLKKWRLSGVSPVKPLKGFGRLIRYSPLEIQRCLEGKKR